MMRRFIDFAKEYENNDVKQSSVFGIGVVAKRATVSQFQPFF